MSKDEVNEKLRYALQMAIDYYTVNFKVFKQKYPGVCNRGNFEEWIPHAQKTIRETENKEKS